MPASVIISIVALAFSALFGFFGLFFNAKNSKRTSNTDMEARVKENVQINMKLDMISGNTTEIKNEVSKMREEINSHGDRIIKVEESAKQAHHRLDAIELRLNGKE